MTHTTFTDKPLSYKLMVLFQYFVGCCHQYACINSITCWAGRTRCIAGFQCHAIKNKNQNHSIDKVQILRKERRWICKDSRQVSGHSNFSYARYAEKLFTQIYRNLYGAAMLVPIRMGTNMAAGNQWKHLSLSFATKAWIYLSRNSKTLK